MCVLTAAVISWTMLIPKAASAAVIPVCAVKLTAGEIQKTVSCNGAVETQVKGTVAYGYPIKISNIHVNVGDYVKAGQKLFDVDKVSTLRSIVEKVAEASDAVNSVQNQDSGSQSTQTTQNYSDLLNQAMNEGLLTGGTYNAILQGIQASSTSSSSISSAISGNISTITDLNNLPDEISSPISGIVTEINVGDDNFSSDTEPLVEISDLNTIQVRAQVDEKDIANIKVDDKANISGKGFSQNYDGLVSKIYPKAEKVTTVYGTKNQVDVIVSVKNPKQELKPGLTADVNILTSSKSGGIVAPFEAIREDDQNNEYVYVYNKGHVHKRYIKTGSDFNSGSQVISGTKAGDTVIINPPENIAENQLVKLRSGGVNND